MEPNSEAEKYAPEKVITGYLEQLKSGGGGNQAEIETLQEVVGDIKKCASAGRAIESHFGQVTELVREMVGMIPDAAWNRVQETATTASDTNASMLVTQHVDTRAAGEVRAIQLAKGTINLSTEKMPPSPWYVNEKPNITVELRKVGEELMTNREGNAILMQKGTYDLLKSAYLSTITEGKKA